MKNATIELTPMYMSSRKGIAVPQYPTYISHLFKPLSCGKHVIFVCTSLAQRTPPLSYRQLRPNHVAPLENQEGHAITSSIHDGYKCREIDSLTRLII